MNITLRLPNTVLLFLLMGLLFPGYAFAQENGKTPRTWKVQMEGNNTYSDVVLKDIIATEAPSLFEKMIFFTVDGYRFQLDEVKRDVIRIRRFYERRGFNDVRVDYRIGEKRKDWKKVVTFEVVENTPIRIDSVKLFVNSSRQDSMILFSNSKFSNILRKLPYREGRRYEPVLKPKVEGDLILALKNMGYAYASSEVQASVDTLSKSATVALINYPGPRTRFDSVKVEGNISIDDYYIARETGIEEGELFSENQLREAQREVFSHHLLRFAIVNIPDQARDSTINVLIRVKESPLRSIQLEAGAGNFNRIHSPAEFYKLFRGQVSWIHRNVRQKGERFSTTAKVSAFEQSLNADYLFPYIYNTKSSVILSPFMEHKLEPSYEIVRGGINNSFVYKYSQKLTGTFSYEYTLNNEITRQSQAELPDSILSYNVSSFSANAYYASGVRQGRKGWLVQPYWELSGLFGEATYSFQKLVLDLRRYTPLGSDVVFAKRLNAGMIYYSAQDSLPSDIRLYRGGTNSVRGWNRQLIGPKRPVYDEEGNFEEFVPIGGRAAFSFNTEFRFKLDRLIKGLGFATFLDGGQVFRSVGDIGKVQLKYGVGGGLRYQSPIGPIRVDLAYKINPDSRDLGKYQGETDGRRWPRWALHFSIGQAF